MTRDKQITGQSGNTTISSSNNETPAQTALTYGRVFALSLPIIVSNFAQPLLGAVDTAVIGHTENAVAIGAVAVGALIISLVFWLFGFLKMVTTGLTAQAYGAIKPDQPETGYEITEILAKALLTGLAIALVLLVLQAPLLRLTMLAFELEAEGIELAQKYYSIRIWSAPGSLSLFCFVGWFIGMQRTTLVMVLMLFANLFNIALDLLFVSYFGWGVAGVAWASLIAEYSACLLGAVLAWHAFDHQLTGLWNRLKNASYAQLWSANVNMMLRTIFLQIGFLLITRYSSKLGATVLAANTILLHILHLMAHALDGFAHAAESLTGEALGKKNRTAYTRAFSLTLHWTLGCGVALALIIYFFGHLTLPLFTNLKDVQQVAADLMFWQAIIALLGPMAFHLDGVFIGATRTRELRNASIASLIAYVFCLIPLFTYFGSHGIWAAVALFMIFRSIALGYFLPALFEAAGPRIQPRETA